MWMPDIKSGDEVMFNTGYGQTVQSGDHAIVIGIKDRYSVTVKTATAEVVVPWYCLCKMKKKF